jgi:uncharacterized protein (DUF2141 family)
MKVRTGLFVAALAGAWLGATPLLAAEDCAGKRGPTGLSVNVSGVRAPKGEVAVTIYPDDSRRFLAPRGKLLRQRVKAAMPTTSACFWLPEPGYYAVAIYHDANADSDFNRNAVGMPAEGFGFSNDAPARFGLPSFNAVRFRVKPGQSSVNIRMRYAG